MNNDEYIATFDDMYYKLSFMVNIINTPFRSIAPVFIKYSRVYNGPGLKTNIDTNISINQFISLNHVNMININ